MVLRVIQGAERQRQEADKPEDQHRWMVFATYVVVTYVISLRGSEGFLLYLKVLRGMKDRATNNHIWLALRGKLKGEKEDSLHVVLCTPITSSGIKV